MTTLTAPESTSATAPLAESSVAEGVAAPRLHIVNLTITGKCNLDCPCCYQKRRTDDLSTAPILKILDEIAALGTKILMMPGGEPLLRKDLDIVVEHAAKLGLEVYLASNGTLVTKERAERLKELGMKGVCVGFEVFDPRAVSETDRSGLRKTIAGIRCFAAAGLETFANLIVTRRNLKHLPRTVKFLRSLGIRRMTILRPKPAQTGPWFDEARLGPKELYRLQILKAKLEGAYDLDFINVDCALGPLLGGLPAELLKDSGIEACLAGRKYISVDSNGDVYPCAYLRKPEWKAGNARRESLAKIVAESPVFEPFRKPALEGHCGECPMKKHCGGCRAMAWHDHQNIQAQDDDCHWGTSTLGRKIVMGVTFWSAMLVRFVRAKWKLRSKGSVSWAERVMTEVPTSARRKRLADRSERLDLCGAPVRSENPNAEVVATSMPLEDES